MALGNGSATPGVPPIAHSIRDPHFGAASFLVLLSGLFTREVSPIAVASGGACQAYYCWRS